MTKEIDFSPEQKAVINMANGDFYTNMMKAAQCRAAFHSLPHTNPDGSSVVVGLNWRMERIGQAYLDTARAFADCLAEDRQAAYDEALNMGFGDFDFYNHGRKHDYKFVEEENPTVF